MLAYPSDLTRCRKPENPSKTTNLERVTTIPRQGAGWLSGRLSDSGARSRGVRNLPSPCRVLEQDILLPESTGTCRDGATAS